MCRKCRILFASDLDNTLIHSYKIAKENEICVEKKAAKELSFMSQIAYAQLQEINKACSFVPITTRSLEQYRRIRLIQGGFPPYAITSNGGLLLTDHHLDQAWFAESKRLIQPAHDELSKALALLTADPNRCFEVRLVDEMFVYTKTENIDWTLQHLKKSLDLEKVCVLNHHSKIYVLPTVLNKGTALRRLKRHLGADHIISAGDSAFDVPMLALADVIFIPDQTLQRQLPQEKKFFFFLPEKNQYFADTITAEIGRRLADES